MISEQLTTSPKSFIDLFTRQEQAIQGIATQLPSLVGGSIENLRGMIKKNGNIKRGELGLLLITSLLLTSGCGTADNPVFKPVLATSTPITAKATETPTLLVQITPISTITELPNPTITPTEVISPTPTKLPNTPTPVPSPTLEPTKVPATPTVEVKPTPTVPTGPDIKLYPAPTPTKAVGELIVYDMDITGKMIPRIINGGQSKFTAGMSFEIIGEYTDKSGNIWNKFHYSDPRVSDGWVLKKSAVEPTSIAPVSNIDYSRTFVVDKPLLQGGITSINRDPSGFLLTFNGRATEFMVDTQIIQLVDKEHGVVLIEDGSGFQFRAQLPPTGINLKINEPLLRIKKVTPEGNLTTTVIPVSDYSVGGDIKPGNTLIIRLKEIAILNRTDQAQQRRIALEELVRVNDAGPNGKGVIDLNIALITR